MVKLPVDVLRFLSVRYAPRVEERPFLERAQTRKEAGLEVTVAVLSDRESERFFGVRMAHKGIQPVWIRVFNGTQQALRLELFSVDPTYYTPLEAAYVNHFALGKRLLSFGLLGWMFLPLIPLVPFKLLGARAANRRMNACFQEHGFRASPIKPGADSCGFVFTSLDEGTKSVDLRLLASDRVYEFAVSQDVPGLAVETEVEDPPAAKEVDESALRSWLARQPRCTSSSRGDAEGDPLNLVVVGDRATILRCFGARWDEAESITFATSLKTAKAFLLDSRYRYSPVSPLYHEGRRQDLALQKARGSINERIHLRLWCSPLACESGRVWIGQVSRDIGVRFTPRTWNLTTHKIDPDVDEARDYVVDDLLAASRVVRVAHAAGVEPAPRAAPRHNLTGDPYFTDGSRAVVFLSRHRTNGSFVSWT